ncbi:MAG TPA: nitrous oxide reductase accessory protein NosL [Cyclobacteriaceae bacterium]|nr:nitrous oxide reductase accessory protein NosL [Cyclobacteriaceae bacterium]
MKSLKPISRITIALCTLALMSAYFVPLWQILMWAPQYPEGLEMKIWIDTISGDVKIISALNHYIGMKHIEVEMFPEFGYMKYIVGFIIAFGLLTALINKRFMLVSYIGLFVVTGIAALVDFYLWGYDYGHNLNPDAPIIIPGLSYQPPLIGTKVLLNFTAFSGPDIGGWIFMLVAIVFIGVLVYEIKIDKKVAAILVFPLAGLLMSCSTEPVPLEYGKDICYTCKMKLMDNKFGAELVTNKGKIYKFDDLNCMLDYYNANEAEHGNYAHKLVIDFARPGTFIEASNSYYLRADEIKSPMASQIAAFENYDLMEESKKKWDGIYLSWGEVVTEFK